MISYLFHSQGSLIFSNKFPNVLNYEGAFCYVYSGKQTKASLRRDIFNFERDRATILQNSLATVWRTTTIWIAFINRFTAIQIMQFIVWKRWTKTIQIIIENNSQSLKTESRNRFPFTYSIKGTTLTGIIATSAWITSTATLSAHQRALSITTVWLLL